MYECVWCDEHFTDEAFKNMLHVSDGAEGHSGCYLAFEDAEKRRIHSLKKVRVGQVNQYDESDEIPTEFLQ